MHSKTNILVLLQNIFKHKLYFIVIIGIASIVGIIDASNRDYIYLSESKLYVTKNKILSDNNIYKNISTQKLFELLTLNIDVITSIKNIELKKNKTTLKNYLINNKICKDENDIYGFLEKNILVELAKNNIIYIKVFFDDPYLSSEVNNKIVEIIIEKSNEIQKDNEVLYRKYYNDQIARVKSELDSLRTVYSYLVDLNLNSPLHKTNYKSKFLQSEIQNKTITYKELEKMKLINFNSKLNIIVLDKAYPPLLRYSPRKKLIVFYYILNAFLICLIYTFYKTLSRSTLNNREYYNSR